MNWLKLIILACICVAAYGEELKASVAVQTNTNQEPDNVNMIRSTRDKVEKDEDDADENDDSNDDSNDAAADDDDDKAESDMEDDANKNRGDAEDDDDDSDEKDADRDLDIRDAESRAARATYVRRRGHVHRGWRFRAMGGVFQRNLRGTPGSSWQNCQRHCLRTHACRSWSFRLPKTKLSWWNRAKKFVKKMWYGKRKHARRQRFTGRGTCTLARSYGGRRVRDKLNVVGNIRRIRTGGKGGKGGKGKSGKSNKTGKTGRHPITGVKRYQNYRCIGCRRLHYYTNIRSRSRCSQLCRRNSRCTVYNYWSYRRAGNSRHTYRRCELKQAHQRRVTWNNWWNQSNRRKRHGFQSINNFRGICTVFTRKGLSNTCSGGNSGGNSGGKKGGNSGSNSGKNSGTSGNNGKNSGKNSGNSGNSGGSSTKHKDGTKIKGLAVGDPVCCHHHPCNPSVCPCDTCTPGAVIDHTVSVTSDFPTGLRGNHTRGHHHRGVNIMQDIDDNITRRHKLDDDK